MSEFQYPQDRVLEAAKALHIAGYRQMTREELHAAVADLPESAPTYTELADAILRVGILHEGTDDLYSDECAEGCAGCVVYQLAERLRASRGEA